MPRLTTPKYLLFICVCVLLVVLLLFFNHGVKKLPVPPPGNTNNVPERTEHIGTATLDNASEHNDAAIGYTFTGKAVRTFPRNKLNSTSVAVPNHKGPERGRMDPWCAQWGVLTTVVEPSQAVQRWVRVEGWCLVIIGDRRSLKVYETRWKPGEGNNAVVYLSPKGQEALNNTFVKIVPWDTFGRKNVGYLYAIMHGASVIWDFDDDNLLKFWVAGAAPEGTLSIDAAIPGDQSAEILIREPHKHNFPTYNPYPVLGAPTLPSWPRGLPPSHIKLPESYDTQTKTYKVKHESVAVLQSLADHQPDLDAIYRITMPVPFSFKRSNETKPLIVPKGVLTPYNSQATLHFEASFWALLLPITVNRQVSDVWRSYIAQRLFWDVGLQVGFLARPLVVKEWNPHSSLRDLAAETDLYQKSEHLVEFLGRWEGKGNTLIERIQELWVTLYEHQFIEIEDITLLQRWLQSLADVGYKFPELIKGHAPWSSPTPQPNKLVKRTDLYQQSEDLVEFLSRWEGKGNTLVEHVKELWAALYKHQYLESKDITLLQRWLKSLVHVGYRFPELVNGRAPWSSPTPQPNKLVKRTDREGEFLDVCETTASLTFWTSDLHDGTRLDIPSALASMGHSVILAGHKQAASPYPFVFQRKGFSVYKRLSQVISLQYRTHTTRLTEKMLKDNFEFYKNDPQIASTDAFMCMFPASMCEMWMPFNKTIVFLPAHRYNLGRCTEKEWNRLNEHLNALVSMDNPKHIIAAESAYDREYLRHYTGLDPLRLYSFSGFYTANNSYAPKRNEILAFGVWDNRLNNKISKFHIKPVHKIYPRYQLSNLVSHPAVVFLPYSVMSYKLTEIYSLCIPLFMPSMNFIRNVMRTVTEDRSSLSLTYCNNAGLDKVMKAHPSSIHPYSPNVNMDKDKEAEFYWLQFADFFHWPHIIYFDDFMDLEKKLGEVNLSKVHDLMVDEVERKKEELLLNLCKASKKVTPGQRVPQDYNVAIEQLYGVPALQVDKM